MATSDITSLVISVKSDGIKEASNSLGGLSTSAVNAERRVVSFTAAMDKLNAMSRLSTTAADSYMVKLREQAALLNAMSAGSRTAAGGTQALAAAMALLSSSLNLMNQNLQQAERHQRSHNNSMREAHALARGLSGSIGALWMTYGAFTGMAVGIAIGASLKGIVTIGKDVEHTLEGIRVRGNETVKSIDAIRESVFELGKGVYGPQEVAKAFETLILAGLKAEQAVSSISAALNLATVGGVSIEKAATTLVSVGTAIGYTAEGFGRVADVIAKTAALSMSSVETLSQAFKSASSVNRLYGISLEDIGTSLGVLSNLGIQGSAAGTALKNFYKELAAESDKVGSTLHKMKLSQAAFKDADGNFKPMLEVVKLLDEGMNRLSKGEAKLAQGRLSNERGQRLMTQLLGEYNTKLGDSDNALAKFRRNVENSYSFAAKGAVQMSLTAKSQIDSMFNTLKTSFAETFSSIQPEVIAFSSRMKSVFGSKDFKDAIAELARWFGKLAISIADNIPMLTKLAVGLIAVKAAMIGSAVWQAAAMGIAAVGTAITGLMAGTLTLTAAMPALAVVLGVAAVAWTAYNLAKGEDTQKQIKDAQAYSNGYISGLTKEAEHLDKVNAKMREKKSLYDATKDVERDESRQMMVKLDNKAIIEAEKNLHDVTSKFRFNKTAQMLEQVAAQKALDKARENATNNTKLAAAAESTLLVKAKENADLAKAQADAARATEDRKTTATLGGKPNIQAANDNYNTTLTSIRGDIEAGKRELTSIEAGINSQFKAGLITEFDKIDKISEARIEKLTANVSRYQQMIDTAAPANKKNVQAIVQNDLNAAKYAVEDEAANKRNQQLVAFERMEEDSFLTRQKRLTLEGHNEEAAVEKYERLYGNKIKAAQNYLAQEVLVNDALESGDVEKIRRIGLVATALKDMEEATAAGISGGKMTDATDATNKALNQMRTEIDAVVNAVPSGGLLAGIAGDQEIDRIKQRAIPELERLYQVQLKLARLSNAPGDIKAAALAGEELRKLKKGVGGDDAWAGAQESIRKYGEEAANTGNQINHVMTNAFKSAEDALVSFVQTGKLDFKSLADSIIADMLRMTIRQAMGGAMGAGGSSAGLMGALISIGGAVFGGGAAAAGGTSYALGSGAAASSTLGSGLQFRAAGGPVNAGESYIVGEKGMEVFEPTVSGNIIPNHSLSSAKGGSSDSGNTTVVYSPTISIDSRTDQAEVRQLVSNAVRQGNSELVETLSRQGRI